MLRMLARSSPAAAVREPARPRTAVCCVRVVAAVGQLSPRDRVPTTWWSRRDTGVGAPSAAPCFFAAHRPGCRMSQVPRSPIAPFRSVVYRRVMHPRRRAWPRRGRCPSLRWPAPRPLIATPLSTRQTLHVLVVSFIGRAFGRRDAGYVIAGGAAGQRGIPGYRLGGLIWPTPLSRTWCCEACCGEVVGWVLCRACLPQRGHAGCKCGVTRAFAVPTHTAAATVAASLYPFYFLPPVPTARVR
jgi:hypothetical protein